MRLIRLEPSKFFPVVFCLLLALISCRVYLQAGLPSTHDSENHLARFANYKIALKEGQFPPRLAPNLFHRYGYPVFNYNYPLPNILSVPFSVLKVPYITTFKLIMTTGVVLLLLGMWTWLSMLGIKKWAKFLAVTSIAASPYLLQTIIFRGSIGEVLAIAGVVWWLVWVENLRRHEDQLTKTAKWSDYVFSVQTLVGGVLLALFFLSHNVTVLFGTPFMLAFSIWWLWRTKKLWCVAGAFVLGLGLSLWFWLPALAEQSAIVVGGSSLAQQFMNHFPSVYQLINAPLQFGFSFIGSVDSLSFAVGWIQLLGLLCFTGWLLAAGAGQRVAKERLHQTSAVFFGLSLILIIFQLSFTTPVWQMVPLARYIQFPWRLGLFLMITSAVVIAWVAHQGIRWQVRLLTIVLLLQLFVGLQVRPAGYFNKSILEYDLFEQSTTTSNENLPKDFKFQRFVDWQPTAIVLDGQGAVTVSSWTGSKRSYAVVAETAVVIVEPTMYFPGWETTVTTGNSYRLIPYLDNETIAGRIAYTLEPGVYVVQTEFTQHTVPRIIGNLITGLSLAFLLGAGAWILYAKVKKSRRSHVNQQ